MLAPKATTWFTNWVKVQQLFTLSTGYDTQIQNKLACFGEKKSKMERNKVSKCIHQATYRTVWKPL